MNEVTHVKDTLPSGLRVITVPMPSTRSVTLLIMAAAGSRYETREINGISHFMEHMFFKGAKKYPDTMSVAAAIDGAGGLFNAFTSEERVAYFVKISSSRMETAYDVLSDMMLHSKFDQEELDKERGVIIEEIRMYYDDPMSRVQQEFKRHFFGDQPLGWDIAGPEEVIQTVTREAFTRFRDYHYTAGNVVIAAAGDIERNHNLDLVSKYFQFEGGNGRRSPAPYQPREGERSLLVNKQTEQAHFVMGFPVPGEDHKDLPALKILSTVMGGAMSSRLFHEIREKRGLAYYISTHNNAYLDTGVFTISTGVNLKRAEEAVKCVSEELVKAAAKGFTEEELTRGRENLKGKLDLSLENSMTQANLYAGKEALTGKIKTPAQIVSELDSVTLEGLNEAARNYFDFSKVKLAVLGPYDDMTPYDKALEG